MINIKLIAILILFLGFITITPKSVSAEYEPGCYKQEGSTFTKLPINECPSEGAARAVSQFGACFVGQSERSCVNLERTGSAVPSPSSSGGGVSREELSQGQCADGLNRKDCGIVDITVRIINFLSALATLAIIGSIMIAGYQYMTAQDNAAQVQQAKTRIYWALTALLLFVFMYAILNFLVPGGILP